MVGRYCVINQTSEVRGLERGRWGLPPAGRRPLHRFEGHLVSRCSQQVKGIEELSKGAAAVSLPGCSALRFPRGSLLKLLQVLIQCFILRPSCNPVKDCDPRSEPAVLLLCLVFLLGVSLSQIVDRFYSPLLLFIRLLLEGGCWFALFTALFPAPRSVPGNSKCSINTSGVKETWL